MENNNERQDVNLDDILSELHDIVQEDVPEVEPDEELQKLLDMPELTITPVVIKKPELPELLPEDPTGETEKAVAADPALEDATVMFTPVTAETAPDAADVLTEDTVQIPELTVPDGDTIQLPTDQVLAADTMPVPTAETASESDTQPKPVEPAFEVEEEFIPSPIIFSPRSRLKELKKQLVAGPEKRYYELSETGTGQLQLALLLNVIVVLICAAVTTMYTLQMVPENRLRLVIFSQVLAMMVSGLLGSHLMIDSVADLLKGRFTVNTLLTITFAVCMLDGILCLMQLRIPCCAAFSLEMTMAL